MNISGRYIERSYQFKLAVDQNVIFITVIGDVSFFSPTSINIFLCSLVTIFLKVFRNGARFDLFIFFPGVPLFGYFDDGGVYDCSAPSASRVVNLFEKVLPQNSWLVYPGNFKVT